MVVLLLIDAMRGDYISKQNTPFLDSCRKSGQYYKRVIPSYGYCERTEILTGQKPNESGFFTAIGYDPINSPYRQKSFLKFASFLELQLIHHRKIFGKNLYSHIYKYFRGACSKIVRKYPNNGFRDYKIPISLLSEFNLTEDKVDHRNDAAFSTPSILKLIEKRKKSYYYDSFTALNMKPNGTDENRLKMSLRQAKAADDSLHLIYVATLDATGHRFGPESNEMNKELQVLDKKLLDYVTKFKCTHPDATFIFLGDHGMEAVTKQIDAESELLQFPQQSKLRLKKDFLYFLDSTLMRVWLTSEKAKKSLPPLLEKSDFFLKNGNFIDQAIAKKYHMPWKDKRYGDIIWQANRGTLIYPDFFHKGTPPYKGMHGYDVRSAASQGTCIIHGKKIGHSVEDSIQLSNIFSVLKKELEL